MTDRVREGDRRWYLHLSMIFRLQAIVKLPHIIFDGSSSLDIATALCSSSEQSDSIHRDARATYLSRDTTPVLILLCLVITDIF